MQCSKCNGMGILIDGMGGTAIICQKCNGSGKEQNNEEWFCDLSTEKKAEVIAEKIKHAQLQYVPTYGTFTNSDWWEKWLKEKHET